MFRVFKNQQVNEMTIEIDENNGILNLLVEGTTIPRHFYEKITLKKAFEKDQYEVISEMIIKSILYERETYTNLQVKYHRKIANYNLSIIPQQKSIVIDIKKHER